MRFKGNKSKKEANSHISKKNYSKMSSLINQSQQSLTAILGEVLLASRAGGAISDQLHLIRIWMLEQNIPLQSCILNVDFHLF